MWQMDAMRRLAAGELAEVVGKAGLESDQDAHRWRMARIAEAQERDLTPASREILAAYARGVNYFSKPIAAACRPNSPLLRYDPRPWSVRDSLLVALQMNRMLTTTWREEMNKFHMLADRRCRQGEFSVSAPHRRRDSAGIERLGDLGRALRRRQADPGQRSAPGMERAQRMVPGASARRPVWMSPARPCPEFPA